MHSKHSPRIVNARHRRLPWRAAGRAGAALGALSLALAAAGPAAAATADPPTAPPPVTILTSGIGHHGGDIFISPFGDTSSYANGPEILSPSGRVIWFHAVPAGQEASDFRAQDYRGHRVLTWWQGTGLGGLASGSDYIYNSRFQQIAVVNAGNGYSADGHEFLITPWNTALILAYTTATADLTSIGGPADQTVIDAIVQEVDIRTGRVLFQWNSADHVPYSDSEQPLPASASTPWDWFHINAVHLAQDGSLLIDARNTWTAYKVNRHTGSIIWQLGGKHSSFTLQAASGQTLDNAGELFAWQHDPNQVGPDLYTFFDNESAGTPELPYSRAIVVRLDERSRTATLVGSDDQPAGLSAASQGNAQTLPDGDTFVGWGALPYFSEFSPSGTLLFNAEFPAGVNSYRAYRLPWPDGGRQHRR
jgi:Arylsulfotransferase (ASST)